MKKPPRYLTLLLGLLSLLVAGLASAQTSTLTGTVEGVTRPLPLFARPSWT